MASPSRLPSARARPGVGGRSRPVSMIEGPMLSLNLGLPNENGTTSKQAKRRSLLPQFSRKVSGEDKDTIREDEESDDVSSVAGSVPDEPRKAMEHADRRAMPPPSRLSRPTSTYGAAGLGRAPSVRSRDPPKAANDARADALAKLTGSAMSAAPKAAAADSGLKRTSSVRAAQGAAPLRGLARTASVKPKESHSRTSSTGTAAAGMLDKRTSVGRPRPPSIDSSLRTGHPSMVSPASPASSTTSRHSIMRAHMPPPPPRPSFSTYQQHYSPAKSALPKPPLPSTRPTRAATVTEDDVPMSFDVTKQQIELLQLSLLHQASTKTLHDYEASARRKLGKKQAKLRKEYESLKAIELEQQRVANLTALDAWCHDPALLAEHLQTLSKVYAEVSALAEDGSRYSELISTFEAWTHEPETAATSSSRSVTGFVEALAPEWHKAHTSLALRLRSLQRDLEVLPPAPRSEESPSSLKELMRSCKELLNGMLRELEMMSKLEKGMLDREKKRVEKEVKLKLNDALIAGSKQRWVPAWQSVV